MLKYIRRGALRVLKKAGVFAWVENSRWRNQRLLILCYHGIAIEEEHKWIPSLYMHPDVFDQRLDALAAANCKVLPLEDAIEKLYRRDLPPKSVAITFDDGTYDFYALAYPRLKRRGFPATVYQTTFYCDHPLPVFHLVCSYMLWKRRGALITPKKKIAGRETLDLRTPAGRAEALKSLVSMATNEKLSEGQKDQAAAELALALDLDYSELVRKRILQLMRPEEISQLSGNGIDFQLHTHRHRTPLDENLFLREIRDNRQKLLAMVPRNPTHFCYPSGVYKMEFLPWLEKENIVSATTCEVDLASPQDHPLLLPRFVDTSARSSLEFESWLSGVGRFISRRHPRRGNLPEKRVTGSRTSQAAVS